MTPKAEGAAGDYIDNRVIGDEAVMTGVCFDSSAPVFSSYWMNQSGEIWSGSDGSVISSGQKIVDSVDTNDSWKYLAKGSVDGADHFIMFNDTEDKVYIVNATSGTTWGSWTYPDSYPDYVSGIDIDGSEILCYNRAAPKRIGKFSLTGTHLDDILLPYPDIPGMTAMVKKEGGFLMNKGDDSSFFDIWTTGTEITGYTSHPYSEGPGGDGSFTDISYDPDNNVIYLATEDPDVGEGDMIKRYEGPPPPPTPTPTATPTVTPVGYKTPIPTPTPATPTPTTPPTPIPTPTTLTSPPPSATYLIIDSGDYDGDGTSDIAIFRGSAGLWSVRGVTRVYYGSSSDKPIPGDYNGDGTSDIGIFRGGSGLWGVRGVTRVYYGSASDIPIPGDYNGDGSCDIGIFRGSSGLWAIRGVTRAYFGGSTDTAVAGDYNGDGTADLGVFRGSSGLWALRNISRIYFGGSTDTVVPSDYNGDGTWEAGVFRSTSGLWAIRGVTRVYFGGFSDEPVPGDYDGDSSDDIGIFRDSSGLWAIRGISRVYFGAQGDIPVTR